MYVMSRLMSKTLNNPSFPFHIKNQKMVLVSLRMEKMETQPIKGEQMERSSDQESFTICRNEDKIDEETM